MCAEFDPFPPKLRSSEIPLVLALILGADDLHGTKCTCNFQSGHTCYQYVMVTWNTKGDVCKNIFASVVALKHCILLKHLEIGQTRSLCFHLHMFKTLLAASLSSMTGGIWSFLVIFSSTSCWASSNSYQTQSVTFCPLKRRPWEKNIHE